MTLTVRPATPADVPQILALIRELAEYERDPAAAKATHADMLRALFGDPARDGPGAGMADCFMGELDGQVQGVALFFMNFSTWTGRPGIYLEDLFVRPAARGHGLGKALFAAVAREAVDRRCARMEWSVIDWNQPAIDFYKSLGAIPMDGWTVHRLNEAALITVGAKETSE